MGATSTLAAGELSSFLAALTDDVARLAFADWSDEHLEPAPVRRSELPCGFRRWWFAAGHHRLDTWERFAGHNWSNSDIWHALQNWRPAGIQCFDHGGASVVAGHPVLVGEPYADPGQCLRAAAEVQETLRCPVTWSPRSHWNGGACACLAVWFTFPAPARSGTRIVC